MSVGYLGNAFADIEQALAANKRGATLTADQMCQVLDVTASIIEAKNELVRENEQLRLSLKPFADEAVRRSWITNLSEKSGLDDFNIGGSGLTNGDLRRAALAHSGTVAPHHDD